LADAGCYIEQGAAVPTDSIGDCIQCPVTNQDGKEYKKECVCVCLCVCVCSTSSLSSHLLMDIKQAVSMSGYCEQGCYKHRGVCISLNYNFVQICAQEWDW